MPHQVQHSLPHSPARLHLVEILEHAHEVAAELGHLENERVERRARVLEAVRNPNLVEPHADALIGHAEGGGKIEPEPFGARVLGFDAAPSQGNPFERRGPREHRSRLAEAG